MGHREAETKEGEVAYTPRLVERLLKSYLDIRYTLEGKSPDLPDTYAISLRRVYAEERVPFGMTPSSQAWPFMEHKRATIKQDGKARARKLEDLHVACLDIEQALKGLSDDDLELVYEYYIFQTKTLDELVADRGLTSRGSMQRRMQRIVKRLTKLMES